MKDSDASVPRLHIVTDEAVLARHGFRRHAEAVLRSGPGLALHLRGKSVSARVLLDLARRLRPVAVEAGAVLLVNDRVDVAIVGGLDGVHLGERSLPVRAVRPLLPRPALVGASVHGPDRGREAWSAGADYLIVGTVYPTPSHPDRPGEGVDLVTRIGAAVDGPLIAIGGVSVERLVPCMEAGAHGVAVLSGVWNAADPAAAARRYLEGVAGLVGRRA